MMLCMALLTLSKSSYSQWTNLILNPSFESGTVPPGSTTPLDPIGNYVTNWTVGCGSPAGSPDIFDPSAPPCGNPTSVDAPNNKWGSLNAFLGSRYVGFTNGEPVLGSLSQTLVAGCTYRVRMRVAESTIIYGNCGVNNQSNTADMVIEVRLRNSVNTCNAGSLLLYTSGTFNTTSWNYFDYTFVATAAMTAYDRIEFKCETTTIIQGNPYSRPVYLDDVGLDKASVAITVVSGGTTVCAGTEVNLSAVNGGTWTASPNDPTLAGQQNNASIFVTPLVTTTYTNTASCSNAQVTITVNPSPVVNLGPDQSVCGGTNIFAGNGFSSYVWTMPNCPYGGANASACVTGNYCVTVSNSSGCTASDCVFITVLPVPNINITSNPSNPCPGDPVQLTAGGTCQGVCQYAWSNGASGQIITVNPTVNTTYTVTATNSSGCTDTDSELITVNPNCLVNQFCKYIQRVGFKDTGAAIEQTADGGFVVVGSMNENSTDRDLYFAKFDANYNIVPGSRKRIGDNSTATLYTDVAYSVVIGSDAYFVIGESRNNTTGDKDVFVARINSTTFVLDWANRYGGTRNEAGIEGVLATSPTGAITLIIVGQTNQVSVTNDDVFALKINTTAASLGSIVTLNTYKVLGAGANEMGTGIKKVSGVFEYIVTARYIAAGNEDIFCFKIQDNLTPAPGATPFRSNGNGNDYAFGLEEIGSNVYLIGKTSTWGTTTNQDIYLLEVNKNTLVPSGPSRTFAVTSTSIEQAYKGQVTTDGNMVIVGDYQTTTPSVTPTKGLAIKVRINPGQLDHLTNMWQIALTNANSNSFFNVSPLAPNHVGITGKYGISSTDEDIFISKVNDLNPLATTCCFKAPVMTSSSGKSTITVTLDPKTDVWTVTAHKKEVQTGVVITNCIDYSLTGNKLMDIPSAIEYSSVGNAMQVYPNPNNGIFKLQLTDETDVIQHLSIIDITGREVKVIWKTGSIVELNLEQEPAGIYFLNVITNTGRYTSRISVNK